nr:hypothetical protein [uncultured Neokomagataea sp.]
MELLWCRCWVGGDSPVIPVTVNDVAAAFFVSPALKHVFVHNAGDLWFPSGARQFLRAQDGNVVSYENTYIDQLKIGDVSLPLVPVLRGDGDAMQSVEKRPILGILGRDFLKNSEVLLDVPHRRFALFQWQNVAGCGDDLSRLFQGTSYALGMDSDAGVRVQFGRDVLRFQLDPDLEWSVMPLSEAHDVGVSDEMLQDDPHETTHYVRTLLGFRHHFRGVQVGGYNMPALDVVVQDGIQNGALGANFFALNVVLFDFPHGRLVFQPTGDRNEMPNLHVHFDQAQSFMTSVTEKNGSVQ